MDVKPVVFALVIGWIAGQSGVPPNLADWLTARETIGRTVGKADCTLDGTPFSLSQVLIQAPEQK